jgi:hypothetical protein
MRRLTPERDHILADPIVMSPPFFKGGLRVIVLAILVIPNLLLLLCVFDTVFILMRQEEVKGGQRRNLFQYHELVNLVSNAWQEKLSATN